MVWQDSLVNSCWLVFPWGVSTMADRQDKLPVLREDHDNFTRLAALSSDGVAIFRGTRIVFANLALAKFVGQTSGEKLHGLQIDVLFAPQNRVAALKMIRAALAVEKFAEPSFRTWLKRADGQTFCVIVCVEFTSANSGDEVMLVFRPPAPFYDSTRFTPSQLQQLVHMQRMTVFGELSAALIHGLGQPLTAAWGACEILAQSASDNVNSESWKRAAEIAFQSTASAANQFRQIWDFVKTREFEAQPVDMNALVASAIETVSATATSAGVSLMARSTGPVSLNTVP